MMDEEVKLVPPKTTEAAKAREESPLSQFSGKIGKAQIIEKDVKSSSSSTNSNSRMSSLSHGFHCGTCNASFTSSDAYLDHCNGRVHQRNLGLSLKVERVDEVDRVRARLQQLTQKRNATDRIMESKSTAHFEKQLDEAEADLEKLKEERKNRKKIKSHTSNPAEESVETLAVEEAAEVDEGLLALMGFKSFS